MLIPVLNQILWQLHLLRLCLFVCRMLKALDIRAAESRFDFCMSVLVESVGRGWGVRGLYKTVIKVNF